MVGGGKFRGPSSLFGPVSVFQFSILNSSQESATSTVSAAVSAFFLRFRARHAASSDPAKNKFDGIITGNDEENYNRERNDVKFNVMHFGSKRSGFSGADELFLESAFCKYAFKGAACAQTK